MSKSNAVGRRHHTGSAARRQWQAEVWIGDETDARPMLFYGETLAALRESAAAWLLANRPPRFCHALEYRDRSPGADRYLPEMPWKLEYLDAGQGRIHLKHEMRYSGAHEEDYDAIVYRFVQSYMLPEKGPDYEDPLVVDDQVQHHRIRTIRREGNEHLATNYVKRGWMLLENEILADPPLSRTVRFVLAHPEEEAI